MSSNVPEFNDITGIEFRSANLFGRGVERSKVDDFDARIGFHQVIQPI